MRAPTLQEKITLKGLLVKKGVPAQFLVSTQSFRTLGFHWYLSYGRAMSEYWRYT